LNGIGAGKSAAAAKGQVARTTDVVLPIIKIRFITFLITLIVLWVTVIQYWSDASARG
jgi:hypothetical protein